MNDSKYRWVLYVIIVVIVATIGIQSYWNYKNYLTNKQQLVNDVQVSLDNAVDSYYANLAERNTIGFAFEADSQNEFFIKNGKFDSILTEVGFSDKNFKEFKKLNKDTISGVRVYQGVKVDSALEDFHVKHKIITSDSTQKSVKWLKGNVNDSLSKVDFEMLTSKVVISMTNETLSLKAIDILLIAELNRKNLAIAYGLSFKNNDEDAQNTNAEIVKNAELETYSKSPYLPRGSKLSVHFANVTKTIFKRIFTGILISILLVLAVIACLFYLLKIIKHQKQLAEVKNDLISNITHEFKTPIATISVALESIKDFNETKHSDKTNRYLDMSVNQLSKLNVMVEKLLETATLDSDNLALNKEEVNIVALLKATIDKFQVTVSGKELKFVSISDDVYSHVDMFHFENAINNIIDNAIKYGGDSISVELKQIKGTVEILISDNGNGLTKAHKEKLFEKIL